MYLHVCAGCCFYRFLWLCLPFLSFVFCCCFWFFVFFDFKFMYKVRAAIKRNSLKQLIRKKYLQDIYVYINIYACVCAAASVLFLFILFFALPEYCFVSFMPDTLAQNGAKSLKFLSLGRRACAGVRVYRVYLFCVWVASQHTKSQTQSYPNQPREYRDARPPPNFHTSSASPGVFPERASNQIFLLRFRFSYQFVVFTICLFFSYYFYLNFPQKSKDLSLSLSKKGIWQVCVLVCDLIAVFNTHFCC